MILKNKKTKIIAFFELDQGEDWEKCTQEEIDAYELEEAKKVKINQCKAYLSQTDWQIIRLSDPTSSEPLKEGVAENRALARSLQDEINDCETLEELNDININFE